MPGRLAPRQVALKGKIRPIDLAQSCWALRNFVTWLLCIRRIGQDALSARINLSDTACWHDGEIADKGPPDRTVMMMDMKWVNAVMAFLCASNFVVSSIRTVLLFTEQ